MVRGYSNNSQRMVIFSWLIKLECASPDKVANKLVFELYLFLTLYPLTSVCLFSIPFSVHFSGTDKENLFKNHLQLVIISFNLITLMFDSPVSELVIMTYTDHFPFCWEVCRSISKAKFGLQCVEICLQHAFFFYSGRLFTSSVHTESIKLFLGIEFKSDY